MSFTDDMDRLQEIIGEFESGGVGMEKSLALFEEGVKLIKACRDYLENAKRRVTLLMSDGVTEIPMDAGAVPEESAE
ncbi:MAG: exodeoxyribonuclease VII small subunit [Synergistaceae bacterium]|jgi:exodeoxyribonuclease VII small subunit|nr:exodeoxyribonuclease VII small subunit [Synergistaceae bacterium]